MGKTPNLGPDIGNPILEKPANNSKTVRDREKVNVGQISETAVGLSKSAVILVAVATGMGETLHRLRQRLA